MRKIFLFMMLSLDGYMEGEGHDLSWHNTDEEFRVFALAQLRGTGTILFGRKTYQLMESYWPSKEGLIDDPQTAQYMNSLPKIVVSQSLDEVTETDVWKHIRLMKNNIKEEIQKLKKEEGKDIAVFGSNNLCVTLLREGLLDEIRIMINPVAIGKGTPLFAGIHERQKFQFMDTRTFQNGNVLLIYQIAR